MFLFSFYRRYLKIHFYFNFEYSLGTTLYFSLLALNYPLFLYSQAQPVITLFIFISSWVLIPAKHKKDSKFSSDTVCLYFPLLAFNYPFYGTQWHPEKNIFEWTYDEDIDHSVNSIFISQHLANFFVMEARKNKRNFGSVREADKYTMFQYQPKYSGRRSHFEQVYVFGKTKGDMKETKGDMVEESKQLIVAEKVPITAKKKVAKSKKISKVRNVGKL